MSGAFKPPLVARCLLRLRVGNELTGEAIRGDLWQEYAERRRREGALAAAAWYWREVASIASQRRGAGGRLRAWAAGWHADARYAFRNLRRAPGFTLLAIGLLALGLGATTSIFTAVNAMFLRPPPLVEDPGRLLNVYTSDHRGRTYGVSSYPDYLAIRDGVDDFAGATAFMLGLETKIGTAGWTRAVFSSATSADYLELLGATTKQGRWFAPDEVGPDAPGDVIVLGFNTWQQEFGGDEGIVGSEVRVDGRPATIIGIAPAGLLAPGFPVSPGAYVPLAGPDMGHRGSRSLLVLGRLTDGATLASAQAQLDALALEVHELDPGYSSDRNGDPRRFSALSEFDARLDPESRTGAASFMGLLLIVAGLVLAIACSNLANLQLVRASVRGGEIAVRRALGAGRRRLLQMLLAESLLLALGGGLVGLLLTVATARIVPSLGIIPGGVVIDLAVDLRVLAFALAASLVTGLLFGLLPALRAARPDLTTGLRGAAGQIASGRNRLRSGLVLVQVTGSVILLAMAGLFLRSLESAVGIDPGFDPRDVALLRLDASELDMSREEGLALFDRVADRLRSASAVEDVVYASRVPLSGSWERRSIEIDGYQSPDGDNPAVAVHAVTPGYFRLMRLQLMRGRGLRHEDVDGAPDVAVVNQAFADRYWPGREALGGRLSIEDRQIEVVGLAATTLARQVVEDPTPQVWVTLAQIYRPAMILHARARTPADATVLALVRSAVQEVRPDLPILEPIWMTDLTRNVTLPQRVASTVLAIAGAMALLLATVGLYGVIAFTVRRRTRELGIRMALGAGRATLVRTVLADTAAMTGLGLTIGLAIVVALGQVMGSFLLNTDPLDPLALGGAAVGLGLAAMLAVIGPVRRATRIDPVRALRAE